MKYNREKADQARKDLVADQRHAKQVEAELRAAEDSGMSPDEAQRHVAKRHPKGFFR